MRKYLIYLLLSLCCYLYPESISGQDPLPVSDSRVALVIGNGDYLSGPLNNTVNDARSMARALRNAGFDVILRENVSNKDEMKRVVREFGMKLQTGGTGLFYYAGHGMQVGGFNYLIPVNAVINIEEEVEYESVDVGFVLAYMESARTRVNVVILDACRNNPFARSFRDSKQGLTGMTAPTGTLIAYATAPGSVASDGPGVNGLYTQELLAQIANPGQKVEDVFKNVRREVVEKSSGRQTPWESSSLIGDFYFHQPSQTVIQQQAANTELQQPFTHLQDTRQEEQTGNESNKETAALSGKTLIPYSSQKTSGTEIRYKWRATPDGKYYLMVDDQEISKETICEVRGENLYVYHAESNRLFILKSFNQRMDGRWRKGKIYE